MKKVTIADVAQHAGVSKSTVSQYLNHRYEYMREETKNRIEESIKTLEYRPNIVARSLKQKSTTTIGVIVANILHTFSTQVIRAIEDTCQDADFHTIVCNADDNPEKERKYIEMLRAKQVDGIILLPTGDNVNLYNEMLKEGYPIVFVDRTVPDVEIPSMLLDNEKASGIGVQHLIDMGYKKIGIITNVIRNVTPRMERINGYKNTMTANGLDVRDDYIKSREVNRIKEGVHELLSLNDPPEAILAGNDLTLIEILKYVKENHMKIPEDIAIIGIDDVSFASFYEPGLTIVAQPTFEIGKKAAEFLLNTIQKKEDQEKGLVVRFDPKLIIRESCKRKDVIHE
ncbi:LacI family DNA-binding transcriptional regulator [Bacillus sp. KH172YL63]|uniref:LacI family DNA-binding transcriptional regulator n=1 Tax=Bacillus sp. KH172YL63 TaxID=2709784 RepID=UPI0013E513A5|nr:substrate-binding domain-containing protein [Bacillus sp. KH172YL63]BCB05198.1 LacI family transcriptional regulator [Bacillus sp. KH172YL63]